MPTAGSLLQGSLLHGPRVSRTKEKRPFTPTGICSRDGTGAQGHLHGAPTALSDGVGRGAPVFVMTCRGGWVVRGGGVWRRLGLTLASPVITSPPHPPPASAESLVTALPSCAACLCFGAGTGGRPPSPGTDSPASLGTVVQPPLPNSAGWHCAEHSGRPFINRLVNEKSSSKWVCPQSGAPRPPLPKYQCQGPYTQYRYSGPSALPLAALLKVPLWECGEKSSRSPGGASWGSPRRGFCCQRLMWVGLDR